MKQEFLNLLLKDEEFTPDTFHWKKGFHVIPLPFIIFSWKCRLFGLLVIEYGPLVPIVVSLSSVTILHVNYSTPILLWHIDINKRVLCIGMRLVPFLEYVWSQLYVRSFVEWSIWVLTVPVVFVLCGLFENVPLFGLCTNYLHYTIRLYLGPCCCF